MDWWLSGWLEGEYNGRMLHLLRLPCGLTCVTLDRDHGWWEASWETHMGDGGFIGRRRVLGEAKLLGRHWTTQHIAECEDCQRELTKRE